MKISKVINFSNRAGQKESVEWEEEIEIFYLMVKRSDIFDRKIIHIKMARTLFGMGLRDAKIMIDDAYGH